MPTHHLTSYFHCQRRKSEKQARPRDHRLSLLLFVTVPVGAFSGIPLGHTPRLCTGTKTPGVTGTHSALNKKLISLLALLNRAVPECTKDVCWGIGEIGHVQDIQRC